MTDALSRPASHRRGWKLAVAFLAAMFVLVGLRPPALALKPDPAVYALVGREILHGAVPYRDVWDNKGPAVLFCYAGLYALFGYRPLLYDLFLIVWLLFLAACVFALGRHFWGPLGAWGAVGMLLFSASFPACRELNAEMIAAPFAVLGMLALLRGLGSGRRLPFVGAGAAFALGALAKPVYLMDALSAGIAVLAWALGWSPTTQAARPVGTATRVARGLGVVLALLGGAALTLTPWLLYFISHGALRDAWGVYVASNLTYARYIPLREALRDAVEYLEGPVVALSALWGLGLAGAWILLATGERPRHERLLGAVWLALTVFGVLVGRRFFYHYLVQPIVPAAVLAGGPLALMARGSRNGANEARRLAQAFAVFFGVVLLLPLAVRLYNAAHAWRMLGEYDVYIANEVRTAKYLRERTGPDDTLFVVGMNAQLPLMTGLRPASRFIYTRYLVEAPTAEARRQVWNLWRQDMDRNRPRYIIISNYARVLDAQEKVILHAPELLTYLRAHYRHETTLRGSGDAHVFYNILYRRQDDSPDSQHQSQHPRRRRS